VTLVVRRATIDDARFLALLNSDVQAIHAAALPWRFKPPSAESFSAAETIALLGNPDNLFFVAQDGNEPAGYVYAEIVRRPETARVYASEMILIHHISVRPGHRRKGIGTALIEATRAAGRDLAIETLALDVWRFNDGAREFFGHQGFNVYIERLWNRQ
jgi:ribosomal protein S18 acetylase RimI-like enzyme